MKLKFKQQQYQFDATMAVVNCFIGQSKGKREELVRRHGLFGDEIFSNKKLNLTPEELLKNIREVQKDQGLKVNKALEGMNFTIEMETGTGKTYVYTKTMYELNAHYGWSKFIIMVPSIAIREGVHKSLEITADHFQEIYGKKIRFTIYNARNKSNLVNIKNFANTSNIEVIIMNYQAFATKSKESRKIYQKLDSIQSEKPIDIIKRARPILIIDEPQRFGDKAESLLHEFNPLFNLRYSATHKRDYNKIYRLDAIDAYNQKLVKRINVKGIEVIRNSGTNSYLFLDRVQISSKHYPTAFIEMEVNQKTGIKKVIKHISEKDDLYQHSGKLAQYKGFIVREINGLKNRVVFTNGVEIHAGQTIGDVDEEHVRRIQIRETIKSHIEKERMLYRKGIKVLSLFFIDEVAKYRAYDDNNNPLKGEYALIFEDEYRKAIQEQSPFEKDYNDYLNLHSVEEIHEGYFSIDKKGQFIDSTEKKTEGGSDDGGAYELIMKNKERLLSLGEPTRFIFSHSALREGWDNPNIFQICTLKHSQSTISKRQEIGRGLRICVNNTGERMDYSVLGHEFFNFNTLTVIASESYDSFARDLQKEIVESLSERPTKLTTGILVGHILKNREGKKLVFDNQKAMDLILTFRIKGYVDKEYKITDQFIEDVEVDRVELPEELMDFKEAVIDLIQSIYTTANFKAADNEKENNINEVALQANSNFVKKESQDLWNRIEAKTIYEVDFNSEELIEKVINALDTKLEVKEALVIITEGEQKDQIDESSLKSGESMTKKKNVVKRTGSLLGALKYDLITKIVKETNLTRKTVVKILQGIKKSTFANFRINPESFIREVSRLINSEKATTLIGSTIYSKMDNRVF
jgi:type III restriction enzyme